MSVNQTQRFLQITIAIITWFAVLLQLYLQIANRTTDVEEAIIRFFSYFTILTNMLVAVCFSSLVLQSKDNTGFFHKNKVQTAVTVYIFIVGLVYNLVLRSQWNPQGWQLVVDNLLHTVTPLLSLIYWLKYTSTKNIDLKQTAVWLVYPFCYLIYVLIRGSFSNFYPYFFIDVSKLGYAKALTNAFYVTLCFFVVSIVLTWLGKRKKV